MLYANDVTMLYALGIECVTWSSYEMRDVIVYVISVLIIQFANCDWVCNIAKSSLSAHYLSRGT